MSQYATRAQLAERMSAKELVGISTAQQDDALISASALADGYLSARFTLPITVYSTELTSKICDLAAYDLLSAKPVNPEGGPWDRRRRYEDAISWLTKVSENKITPVGITDSSVPERKGGKIRLVTSEPRGW